ncbi:MAG: MarR family transcriptional regulator [Bacteroidota bacterium]|nr:MarR family transcriptional regulator [Bacteroidota bacterium]
MKTPDALHMRQFASPQQQLALTVLHTASSMLSRHRTLLKPHGVTPEQFNILRILKGQQGQPIALRDISSRMIDRNSNTSRLIDKLTEKGLVQRESCPNDRRRVDIVLTPEGLHMTDMLKNIMDEEMSLLEEVWPKHLAEAAIETLDAWNDTQP